MTQLIEKSVGCVLYLYDSVCLNLLLIVSKMRTVLDKMYEKCIPAKVNFNGYGIPHYINTP